MVPWNAPRAKVQIRLSIQRLRTLQEKRLALAKKSRREIADLLQKGRIETARLRVEGLVQDDIYVELLEVLELYSEMLQARFNLLDASTGTEPDPSISDAVCAIVYAAPRTELKELQVLREILMHKFGRAFSLALQPSDPPPSVVPARVLSKLRLYTPSKDLVDAYLYEIAKSYGVDWAPDEPKVEALPGAPGESQAEDPSKENDDDEGDGPGEGQEAEAAVPDGSAAKKTSKEKSPEKEVKNDEGKGDGGKMPDPPSYPAGQERDAWAGAGADGAASGGKKMSEEEELAKRFERLKNLR